MITPNQAPEDWSQGSLGFLMHYAINHVHLVVYKPLDATFFNNSLKLAAASRTWNKLSIIAEWHWYLRLSIIFGRQTKRYLTTNMWTPSGVRTLLLQSIHQERTAPNRYKTFLRKAFEASYRKRLILGIWFTTPSSHNHVLEIQTKRSSKAEKVMRRNSKIF